MMKSTRLRAIAAWQSFLLFLRRIVRLPGVLRPRERLTALIMLIVIGLAGTLIILNQGGTKPAYGGTYTEAYVGQPRFIDPILASSDVDTSLSELIYSGLTKVDANGLPKADLADHWSASDNGKQYTFFLRHNVLWHDGKQFTAQDVLFTINLIKDPTVASPLYQSWKDITAAAPDDFTVIFSLKDSLATFPWLASVGILPSHIDKNSLNNVFIGTGPYKYSKVRMQSGTIQSIVLVRNPKWYGAHLPYIDAVEFWFYADDTAATKAILGQKVLGSIGQFTGAKHLNTYDLTLAHQSALFLNTQSKALSDIAVRQKIINTTDSFNPPLKLSVVVDGTNVSQTEFQALIDAWQKRNIEADVDEQTLDSIKSSVLAARTYDAIAVSVDNGPQVDQYAYWHSSQGDGAGLNFARLKNTDLDKLVLQQKQATDLAARSATITQIQQLVGSQAVEVPLWQNVVKYSISKSVHPTFAVQGNEAADRFDLFDQWYIKTRR